MIGIKIHIKIPYCTGASSAKYHHHQFIIMDAAELMSVVNNCSRTYLPACESVYAAYVYVLTPICIIGVVFNCLSLAVFLSKPFYGACSPTTTDGNQPTTMSTATAHVGKTLIHLIALATADVLCLLVASAMGPVRCVPVTGGASEVLARQFYEVVMMPLLNTFAAASVWFTTIITVKRFFYVRRRMVIVFAVTQLTLSNSSGRRRTWLGVVLVYVGALVAHLPYFFTMQIDPSKSKPVTTEFGTSFAFQIYLWIRMVVVKLIPITLVIASNIALVSTLLI